MQPTMSSRKADEINQHLAFIEWVVAMGIKPTPADCIMGKVVLNVRDKLERIKYLNNCT